MVFDFYSFHGNYYLADWRNGATFLFSRFRFTFSLLSLTIGFRRSVLLTRSVK